MVRSKALINAVMPVYFVWYKKTHISNGTAKSVGSHSVSNTRSSGISVEDCDQTEILVTGFDSSSGLAQKKKRKQEERRSGRAATSGSLKKERRSTGAQEHAACPDLWMPQTQ
jgi:hypothetical protein